MYASADWVTRAKVSGRPLLAGRPGPSSKGGLGGRLAPQERCGAALFVRALLFVHQALLFVHTREVERQWVSKLQSGWWATSHWSNWDQWADMESTACNESRDPNAPAGNPVG